MASMSRMSRNIDPASVRAAPVRKEANYEDVRVILIGTLDSARCPVQIDVGYGEAVTLAYKKPRPRNEKRGFMDFAGLLRMSRWCLRPESNRHAFRRLILSQVRLPIPPQRLQAQARILAHGMQN